MLASIAFFLLFALNFATSQKPIAQLLGDQVYNINDNIGLTIIAVLGGALALLNIFLFNNRKLQIKLGYIIILICIALPLFAGYLMYSEGAVFGKGLDISYGVGLAMPILAIVFTILANKFIKKDDKLVRSADRLR